MPRRRTLLFAAAAAAAACGRAPALAAASSTALATTATAAPPASAHEGLAHSRRIGQGTLRVFGLAVYDAALFALPGFDAASFEAHPLVLEIHYRRAFAGHAIAEYSLEQMRRGGPVDDATAQRWLQFMRRACPDVLPGDRLTGLWQPVTATSRFSALGGAAAALQDAGFGRRFFGIWLAPTTPRPELRDQLLGRRPPG